MKPILTIFIHSILFCTMLSSQSVKQPDTTEIKIEKLEIWDFAIKKVIIVSGNYACFGANINHIEFEIKENKDSLEKSLVLFRYKGIVKDKISMNSVQEALAKAVIEKDSIPGIVDFNITEQDFEAYYKFLDTGVVLGRVVPAYVENHKIFVNKLHEVSPEAIKTVINHWDDPIYSTSHNGFTVAIIGIKEKIVFENTFNSPRIPFLSPWEVTYKEEKFKSYNIAMNQLLEEIVPSGFAFREALTADKNLLLWHLAIYDKKYGN